MSDPAAAHPLRPARFLHCARARAIAGPLAAGLLSVAGAAAAGPSDSAASVPPATPPAAVAVFEFEGPGGEDLALGVNGLYPLWEQTAVLHPRGTGQVGYGHAQLGTGRVQLGTQPFANLYGTWNAQVKVGLYSGPAHRFAATAGAYRVPQAAEARMIGDLHRAGFANPYAPVGLFPIALAHSFTATPRLTVHTAGTGLLTTTLATTSATNLVSTSFGLATLLDWRTTARTAARVHAGVRGIGVDTAAHLGLSFGVTTPRFLASAGYIRSAAASGESRGDFLFDVGLLFR
jgi:hypothetical protein